MNGKGMVLGMLLGSALGASLAMLYAPKSGREMRDMAATRFRKGRKYVAEGARETMNDLRSSDLEAVSPTN